MREVAEREFWSVSYPTRTVSKNNKINYLIAISNWPRLDYDEQLRTRFLPVAHSFVSDLQRQDDSRLLKASVDK